MSTEAEFEQEKVTEVVVTGAPAMDSDSFVEHTVGVREVNDLTIEIDALLTSGMEFEEAFAEFAPILAEDDDGRFAAIFSRSVTHLTFMAEEMIAKISGVPEPEYLQYLVCLSGFAFGSVSDRVFLDEIDPQTRVQLANMYDRIGTTVLQRTLHAEDTADGAEAAITFLSTTRILLNSNDSSDFAAPLAELQTATRCVEVILDAFIDDTYAEDIGEEDIDALVHLAFDIAASSQDPELAETLLEAYSFYQAEIDSLVNPPPEEDEQDEDGGLLEISWKPESEQQETSSATTEPDYEDLQAVRAMELVCLKAFALCAASREDAAFLKGLLDARIDGPEFSSALLGLARVQPAAVKPYIVHAICETAEGEPVAAQGLFNLIETDTAYDHLMEAFHQLGAETTRQAVVTLHRYIGRLLEGGDAEMTEAGFDIPIGISLSDLAEPAVFIRQLTASRFEEIRSDLASLID